ncbi:hypothetical protein DQ04_00321060 [Trypanosoma grayi]|uniref:hypothetical protein n=1 Tax=Trypanosoma grayi TaxID=71804 RepID=UPI0004F47A39|nr:hypothetical protein DQ04_00321060 [Trypanosoma grayi]KEG14737.1 hypothetical protein DQ04_00321060 [Trypanosoma grayi]
MFRGAVGTAGRQWRSERRLAALVTATSRNPTQKWTHHVAKASLARQRELRTREEEARGRKRTSSKRKDNRMTAADIEFLRSQQDKALADDDTRTGASMRSVGAAPPHRPSSSRHVSYDRVDSNTGNSVIQQRFDSLVHDAILKYGPPLPVEFVVENDVFTPSSAREKMNMSSSCANEGDPDASYFYDEVHVRSQELFEMLRRVDSSFSVRTHADGVPFSLLIKNCQYFRVWGGRVHFMRCLKRVPLRARDEDTEAERMGHEKLTVSLGKYKMREPSSFDGLRQGPQPWLHSYRMM